MIRKLILPVCVLVGCHSPVAVEPDENGRVLGTIEHYGDGVRIDIPAVVAAGGEFSVRVQTFGGGCTAKGDTEMWVGSRAATIRPYDLEPTTSMACLDILVVHTHEAVLRFDRRGTATVTIIGKRRPGDKLVTISRSVLVQ